MHEVVILSAVRTPIGAFQGSLAALPAHRLGASALAGAIERASLKPEDIDQVYLGCVLQSGQGQAPARQATLGAGCPVSTGAVTIHKVCGSGMRSVMTASNDLRCGDFEIVAAGGMESMSQAPYLLPGARSGYRLGHNQLVDSMIHDGLWDPYEDQHMGNCAETCADEYSFSREEQDAFSAQSYARARDAVESGRAAEEIVTVQVKQRRGDPIVVDRDEQPFKDNLEKLGKLRPAFQKDGTVTAGNASKINDGAAALILTTAEVAEHRGLEARARVLAHATYGQAPEYFTTAPIRAVEKVLARAGLEVGDIDLWEINEAFAVVTMAAIKDLGLDPEKVNVRGGAVAMGHPIGASGARIIVTLLHAMEERGARRGCAAICLGGGEATAVVVERGDSV
jgi:acetyl-CoA C-acetyltransferase